MTKQEAIAEGYQYYCASCHGVWKEKPTIIYEDGHGGCRRAWCKRCDDNLIVRLDDDQLVE